jgi:biotin carboxyl carrier protein
MKLPPALRRTVVCRSPGARRGALRFPHRAEGCACAQANCRAGGKPLPRPCPVPSVDVKVSVGDTVMNGQVVAVLEA